MKLILSRRTQAPANVAENAHNRKSMESTPKSTPCTITMMYFGASADESAGSENFTWKKHYEKVIYSESS